jgi:hypothetical protein
MRRYCVWSSFVALTVLVACGGSSADDLYKGDGFGTVLRGGGSAVSSGGAVVVASGGAPTVGGAGSSSGGVSSSSGGVSSTGGTATSTGGSASGGLAGAAHGGSGGTLSSGGSSLGGAAGKGGTGGVAGTGGSGSGGSSGKTCDQLLAPLPDLLSAAQACTTSSATACNGFVKNHSECMVAVNETGSAATKAYTDAVAELKSQCGLLCTGVVCATVTAASCITSGTGSAGHCLGR